MRPGTGGKRSKGVIDRALIVGLSAAGLASCGALLWMLRQRWHALKWAALSVCAFLMEYILAGGALFVFDAFSIDRALEALLAANALGMLARGIALLVRRRRPEPLDWSLRPCIVPLALVMAAVALSWTSHGYFGMGQDQGVYQVKAIDLMNGHTRRVYHFEEYDRLETDAQRKAFLKGVKRFGGLNNILKYREENEALLKLLDADASLDAADADAVYHGIPTYPALLALFGVIGGDYARMMDVQTLLYALGVLLLWFTAENMGFRRGARALTCVLCLLSPEWVWLSKSSLVELLLAVILLLFLFFLTDDSAPGRRWWSVFAVAVYAISHITICVSAFFFWGLYCLLYLYSRERQYLRAAAVTMLLYIAGYTAMVILTPRYALRNATRPMGFEPDASGRVYVILMGCGLIALLAVFLMPWLGRRARLYRFVRSRALGGLFRWALALTVAAALGLAALEASKGDVSEAIVHSGMYVFMWLTGLFAIPVSVVFLLRRRSRMFGDVKTLALAFFFLYGLAAVACLLCRNVKYCYYYARYFGPYVPVVCLMFGYALRRTSGKTVAAAMLAGALAMAPFDGVLLLQRDDTFCSFRAVEEIAGTVDGDDAAVVFSVKNDAGRLFYLPVRAMTGVDCYPSEEDIDAQMTRLAVDHGPVFLVTAEKMTNSAHCVLERSLTETRSLDDDVSNRVRLCPLPLGFKQHKSKYYIYRYDTEKAFAAEELRTNGSLEDARISLEPGQLQYGPYIQLEPGRYQVEIAGENLLGADVRVTHDAGKGKIAISNVTRAETGVRYEFTLDRGAENVEFLLENAGESTAWVDRIVLRDLTER